MLPDASWFLRAALFSFDWAAYGHSQACTLTSPLEAKLRERQIGFLLCNEHGGCYTDKNHIFILFKPLWSFLFFHDFFLRGKKSTSAARRSVPTKTTWTPPPVSPPTMVLIINLQLPQDSPGHHPPQSMKTQSHIHWLIVDRYWFKINDRWSFSYDVIFHMFLFIY